MEENSKKKRKLNFELLRIVAMCMIIGLHYLDKGGICSPFLESQGTKGLLPWFFEACFMPAVNVYVLISGYFLVGKEIKLKRIFQLWGQILFYSIFLFLLAGGLGLINLKEMNIYEASYYIFPVLSEHYWFATDYILLYFLLFFCNPMLFGMEKKKMQKLLLLLVAILCISKTVFPVALAIDKNGYDVLWFFCLYLTGAYYRRFGFAVWNTKIKGLLLYGASVGLMFASAFVLKEIFLRTGHFKDIVTYAYSYNHLLCYTAAIGLLVCFSSIKIPENKVGKIIGLFGGATFGVYLLHEHRAFRYVWQGWFQSGKHLSSVWFPVLMAGTVLSVFIAGACIELLRGFLTQKLTEFFKHKNNRQWPNKK